MHAGKERFKIARGVRRFRNAVECLVQTFGAAALGDIAEDQDRPLNLSLPVANGSDVVVDGTFRSVRPDQKYRLGGTMNRAGPQGQPDRLLGGRVVIFPD